MKWPGHSDEAAPQRSHPLLRTVRERACRRVLWLRELWQQGGGELWQGMAITHAEIDRILADPEEVRQAEAAFYGRHDELEWRIREAERELASDPHWSSLRGKLGLSDHDCDLLSLAVAAEIDPSLRRLFGYLNDDTAATHPSLQLAGSLFQWLPGESADAGAKLVEWRLAAPMSGEPYWSPAAPWKADQHMVPWLLSGDPLDQVKGLPAQFRHRNGSKPPCLYPELSRQIAGFLEQAGQRETVPVLIELTGGAGSGRRTLAWQVCARLGRDLLVVDCREAAAKDAPAALETLIRAVRVARLTDAALFWHAADALDEGIWQKLEPQPELSFAASPLPCLPALERGGALHRGYRLPPLSRSRRVELWRHLSRTEQVPEAVADWLLTPAEITRLAPLAFSGPAAVNEACRGMLHRESGELFSSLPTPYGWPDIVLQAGVKQQLRELEAQAKLRWSVYEEWGFGRLCPLGKGISALFSGPSGTGKTMAAQVLAATLERELYRVDLSGVVNKYVGETEKRLKRVFDECERSGVLLFFDEADALFGHRSQAKDAHDRFANIEIDYLLQRMEQFDGVAILATNRKSDLDPAFLRRLRFIVDFMPPGIEERLELWKKALLGKVPNGERILGEIDWGLLAHSLPLTGADIKNAALGAAFLAKAEGAVIGMEHLFYAARREMAKQGMAMRPGSWPGRESATAAPSPEPDCGGKGATGVQPAISERP